MIQIMIADDAAEDEVTAKKDGVETNVVTTKGDDAEGSIPPPERDDGDDEGENLKKKAKMDAVELTNGEDCADEPDDDAWQGDFNGKTLTCKKVAKNPGKRCNKIEDND